MAFFFSVVGGQVLTLPHHLALARRIRIAASRGKPELVTTSHSDLLLLQVGAAVVVAAFIALRAAFGGAIGVAGPFGALAFGSVVALGVALLHPQLSHVRGAGFLDPPSATMRQFYAVAWGAVSLVSLGVVAFAR